MCWMKSKYSYFKKETSLKVTKSKDENTIIRMVVRFVVMLVFRMVVRGTYVGEDGGGNGRLW